MPVDSIFAFGLQSQHNFKTWTFWLFPKILDPFKGRTTSIGSIFRQKCDKYDLCGKLLHRILQKIEL